MFEGTWVGTSSRDGAGELGVEIVIAQGAGTWRWIPRGAQARNNPCLGKYFPVTVTAQPESEIQVQINGASVIAGCINQAARLKVTGNDTLEGSLEDGRVLKLKRH